MKVDAKKRLLKCAIKEFADKGFDGASTREIVKQAGMNISAISYYYGSKEGLYNEILNQVATFVNASMAELLKEYDELLLTPDGEEKAAEATKLLTAFIRKFLQLICSGKHLDNMRAIFIQEYTRQSQWFYGVLDNLSNKYFEIFSKLLLIIHGDDINKEDASLSTFMIFSQMFVFFVRKDAILAMTGWKEYNEENIDKMLAKVSRFFRIEPDK